MIWGVIGFIYVSINIFDFLVLQLTMNELVNTHIHAEDERYKYYMISTPYIIWTSMKEKHRIWKLIIVTTTVLLTIFSIILKSVIYELSYISTRKK